MKLQGKVALITGADSGIGQATAELFAQEGADVCIAFHTDQSGAEETKRRVEAAGRRALVVQCDVGDPATVTAMFEQAQGLGTLDILVNNVAPGLIETPMTQETLEDPKKAEASMRAIPWHRPGQPEEIARVVLFLASDDGDYVTGQTWVMDGGLTMNWGGA